jgi:hypothetical protein
MVWRARFAFLATVIVSLLSLPAQSQTLYIANGSGGVAGDLYTVNTTTAATTVVGPILVGALPVAITGLAFHPTARVLFAITSNNSPNLARHLLTINPATGAATDIGALGISGADIAFSAAGTLYMSSGSASSLFTVNITTGATTLVGATGVGDSGSGLAINGAGTAYFAGNGANGQIVTLNLGTGAATAGPTLTGAPHPTGTIDSMKFSSTGVLFAVNNANAPNNLVTINVTTGAVTNIGVLPNSIDGLAFAPPPLAAVGPVPTLGDWVLVAMALLLGGTGLVAMRRRIA